MTAKTSRAAMAATLSAWLLASAQATPAPSVANAPCALAAGEIHADAPCGPSNPCGPSKKKKKKSLNRSTSYNKKN